MSRDMISLDFVSGVLQAVKDKLRTLQPDYRQKLRTSQPEKNLPGPYKKKKCVLQYFEITYTYGTK